MSYKWTKKCTECGGAMEWKKKIRKWVCRDCGVVQASRDDGELFARETVEKKLGWLDGVCPKCGNGRIEHISGANKGYWLCNHCTKTEWDEGKRGEITVTKFANTDNRRKCPVCKKGKMNWNTENMIWVCEKCLNIEVYNGPECIITKPQSKKSDGVVYTYSKHICDHDQDSVEMGGYLVCLSEAPPYDNSKNKNHREDPDYGIYLDGTWARRFSMGKVMSNQAPVDLVVPYPILMVDWPDRGVVDMNTLNWLVNYAVERIKNSKIVEIGCFGGHGRTGTLAACVLGKLEELDGETAIKELRRRYCKYAIESKEQEELIKKFCKNGYLAV